MANVFDVANCFIETAGEESDVSNLKLNKLLYCAQGIHLARTGKTLFENAIEASPDGPVVAQVYQTYKVCRHMPIPHQGEDVNGKFSDEEKAAIIDAAARYGKYTASHLVKLTSAPGSPWDCTDKNNVIPNDSIKEYFLAHELPMLMDGDLDCLPRNAQAEAWAEFFAAIEQAKDEPVPEFERIHFRDDGI